MKGLISVIAFVSCIFAAGVVGVINGSHEIKHHSYSFVCFDQYQNSTRRPSIVGHSLRDGGVFVLKHEDGSTSFYMQQHGEDCYIEEASQKHASTGKHG